MSTSTAPTVLSIVERFQRLPSSKWHMDGRHVAQLLDISFNHLNSFTKCIASGGIGKRSDDSWIPNPAPYDTPIDLTSRCDNILNLHCADAGNKNVRRNSSSEIDIAEPSPDVLNQTSRFFQLGRIHTHTNKAITPKTQREIVKFVIGTHQTLTKSYPDIAKFRQENWRNWVSGGQCSGQYQSLHLPFIALEFIEVWDAPVPATTGSISATILNLVKNEILDLFVCMFIIPTSQCPDTTRRSARHMPTNDVSIPVTAPKKRRATTFENEGGSDDDQDQEHGGHDFVPTVITAVQAAKDSMSLGRQAGLRHQWFEGRQHREIGSLEIAASEAYAGGTLESTNLKISKLGGIPRTQAQFDAIKSIGKSELNGKLKNFQTLKSSIEERLEGIMPSNCFRFGDGQFLLEYIKEGERFTKGQRLPRETHVINKDNDQLWLTDESAHYIRHMINCYHLSITKFNGLLNCMAVYFLGRQLKQDEFSSTATVRLRLRRLAIIDRKIQALVDRETFGKSPNGFYVLYYVAADGTTHHKNIHHQALIRTGGNKDGKKEYIVLTSSQALGKGAKDNAKLNLKMMIKNIDEEVLAYFGGGAVDNAASARDEIHQTFDGLMEHLKDIGSELHQFYGVTRLAIVIPDGFHIDSILTSAASIRFSGDTDRGNHRYFHARQLLQTIHSLHSACPELSQKIIDKLLKTAADPLIIYILKTCRERMQRWLVNGKYAARILEMMDIMITTDGESLLTHWAKEMHTVGGKLSGDDSKWMKDASEDVVIMSQSPVIKIALTFEMELVVKYFDVTHSYHGWKGEFDQRPGFVTMELHRVFFDFIIPFWLLAKKDPAAIFTQTMQLINQLGDENLKRIKMEQLTHAIDDALDKVSKNSELLLEAPLIFLLVTHPVEGPYVLRAILACIQNLGVDLDDVDAGMCWVESDENVEFDEDNKWDTYTYGDLNQMPAKERVYYEQLLPTADKVLHYFRQFGFSRAILRDSLIKLSRERDAEPARPADSETPLHDFKAQYPLIYEALNSVFGFSASNSRIVEMLHSWVRSFFEPNMPREFLDDKLRYLLKDESENKEQRRDISEARRDSTLEWRPAKDQDRKETESMIGQQLLDGAGPYLPENVERLCQLFPDAKEEIKVRNIMLTGTTKEDQEYVAEVNEAYLARRQSKVTNSRCKQLDLNETRAIAKDRMTDHDKDWDRAGDREYAKVVEKVATVAHFKSIEAGKLFFDELKNVLTHLGDIPMNPKKPNEMLGKTALTDPGGFVNAHIKLIQNIARGKVGNSITDDDISDMTYDERLQLFVAADKSIHLEKIKKEIQEKFARLEAIYEQAASSGIAPRFRKMMERPLQPHSDDDSNDDDESLAGVLDTSMEGDENDACMEDDVGDEEEVQVEVMEDESLRRSTRPRRPPSWRD